MPVRLIILGLLIACSFSLVAQSDRYLSRDYEFERGSTEYLFGNKVVLREEPSVSSPALDTLMINEELVILKKTKKGLEIGGRSAIWYEVHTRGRKGYIPDRYIALDRATLNGDTYLLQYHENAEGDNRQVVYRLVLPDHHYLEGKVNSRTYSFGMGVEESHQLEGVHSVLTIFHFAEACGVTGGKTVVFHVDNKLLEVADLGEMGDSGVVWFMENLEYTSSDETDAQHVFYTREIGEYMDEELEWEEVRTTRRVLHWMGDHFEPSVSEVQKAE